MQPGLKFLIGLAEADTKGAFALMEKPFHEWTRNELRTKERVYPIADEYGEIRAEIIRRAALRNERYLLASVVVAAISALGSMIAAVATLLALYRLR